MNESVVNVDLRQTGSGRTRLVGTLMLALVLMLPAVGQARAAANSNPPTPYFVTPQSGSTVSNTVTVVVFAPEYAYWITELGVDGGNWQLMSNRGEGTFFLSWNTGYASNGKHTLTARFTNELGGPPVAAVSIRVWVQNEEPDGQASILPLPCAYVLPPYSLKGPACAAPDAQAFILPLPCIHVGAGGLKPADCAAPATT
jgi:hypothetical protein